jgi:hypothetical protein
VPGSEGGKRGRKRNKDNPGIPEVPATLPLTGNETITIKQPINGSPWWTRAFISILTLIRQFWPASWSWSGLNLKADTPNTVLFSVPNRDMLYRLAYAIVTKSADGGASTGTLLINFTNLNSQESDAAGSLVSVTQPVSHTLDLATATPNGITGSLDVLLAAGSGVSFSFLGGGTYGAAAYDLIVSAIPQCSDQGSNQADNLLI